MTNTLDPTKNILDTEQYVTNFTDYNNTTSLTDVNTKETETSAFRILNIKNISNKVGEKASEAMSYLKMKYATMAMSALSPATKTAIVSITLPIVAPVFQACENNAEVEPAIKIQRPEKLSGDLNTYVMTSANQGRSTANVLYNKDGTYQFANITEEDQQEIDQIYIDIENILISESQRIVEFVKSHPQLQSITSSADLPEGTEIQTMRVLSPYVLSMTEGQETLAGEYYKFLTQNENAVNPRLAFQSSVSNMLTNMSVTATLNPRDEEYDIIINAVTPRNVYEIVFKTFYENGPKGEVEALYACMFAIRNLPNG